MSRVATPPPAPAPAPPVAAPRPQAVGRGRLGFPKIGWVGVVLVGLFVLMALLAPHLTPYRVTELAGDPLEPPSGDHLLGTNAVGQDVASQLLQGARVSLFVALFAGGGTLLVGSAFGLIAGWAGGRTDAVLMRFVDVVLIIPKIPLLIVAGAYAGPSLAAIAVIIALTSWPPTARVVRSQVLSLRRRAHVKAAMSFGASSAQILRRHILPEVALILVAGFVAAAGRAISFEAGLAFLGLGDPSRASWGAIVRDAIDFGGLFFTDAWAWWLVPPVVAVSLLLLGVTLLGVGVEHRLNPRVARHAPGGAAA
jgi:ABC-type dipeptide/oligopeptide/nickel transport system permease subunit